MTNIHPSPWLSLFKMVLIPQTGKDYIQFHLPCFLLHKFAKQTATLTSML